VSLALVTSLFYLTLGVLLLLLGLTILRENLHQRINRITGVMMALAGTGPVFAAFGLMVQNVSAAQINLALFRKLFLVWEFFFPQMFLFSLVYPREIRWVKRHPLVLYAIFLPHAVHFLLVISFSSPEQIQNLLPLQVLTEKFGLLVQPLVILVGLFLNLLSLVYQFHTNFFALINLIYIIAAIVLMTLGHRALKGGRLKRQVGFVLWGIRASVSLYAVAFLLPRLNVLAISRTLQFFLTTLALLIGSGSIAWAIIRYQFLDIRVIIRRGLIFSIASAVLIGVYLQIYRYGKQMITASLGIEIPVLEILFILFAMFLFQPILSGIERTIERLFIRDRMDYRNVLKDLSHDIMTTLDPPLLRGKIIRTLQESLSLETVELFHASVDGRFAPFGTEAKSGFKPKEEWIQHLREWNAPVSLEQLSVLVKDEKSLEGLRRLGAFLLIPLAYRDRLVGILMLGEKVTKTNFSTEDMTLLSVLSNQIAIAMENARLYNETLEKQRIEEDLRLAREIQRNLLPRFRPQGKNFEITGFNLPSREVGGDYYDFIPLSDDRIGVVIGDISGKGIPAAILMSNLQATVRISALHAKSTAEVMHLVNNQIIQTTSVEKFATLFYCVFDAKSRSLEYTNAGHNFPIHWSPNRDSFFLKEGGLVIGVLKDAPYQSAKIRLLPGELLVFYTDGVTEARNKKEDEFGEARLIEVISRCSDKPAESILETILDSVTVFTDGNLESDDLTLVVMKVK
jgi:sigma-B regulation protein RsbU (phosphoserine phosphatase)